SIQRASVMKGGEKANSLSFLRCADGALRPKGISLMRASLPHGALSGGVHILFPAAHSGNIRPPLEANNGKVFLSSVASSRKRPIPWHFISQLLISSAGPR